MMTLMRRHKIGSTVVILGAVWLFVILVTRGHAKGQDSLTRITPEFGTIASSVSTTGTVEPQNRLELMPTVAGRIEDLKVNEGDRITKGQVLALISSTERAALLDAARLQEPEKVEYWSNVYKPVPLVSPIDGEVIVREKEPGQSVTTAEPIVVISDRLVVVAQVDETDIGAIKNGQDATITLDAYPDQTVAGKVVHISFESSTVNNVTIYEVDIVPVEIPDVFRSGMSANVEIFQQKKENVLLVPISAVQKDESGSFVEVERGKKKTERVPVVTGVADEDSIEIVSGVTADDTVLTNDQVPQAVFAGASKGSNPFMPQRPERKKK